MEEGLVHASTDAANEVRQFARASLAAYQLAFPERADAALAALDAPTRKAFDEEAAKAEFVGDEERELLGEMGRAYEIQTSKDDVVYLARY